MLPPKDFRDPSVKEHFDFSEYPKDHPDYDPTNAKVLGEFTRLRCMPSRWVIRRR